MWWEGVVIHHTATRDDVIGFESEGIKQYHLSKGWQDIGYHYVIERVRGRLWIIQGRLLNMPGAHCRNHNSKYIGIAFCGNFNLEIPKYDMLVIGAKLVKSLMMIFNFKEDKIFLHKELNDTDCPGQFFSKGQFINLVKQQV